MELMDLTGTGTGTGTATTPGTASTHSAASARSAAVGPGPGDGGGRRAVLYVIGCAAPPVLRVHAPLRAARDHGWNTCLVLTPTAAAWLKPELPALAELTGHPVRSEYRLPGEPDALPRPDAILVAPATANTMNKCTAGISDTLALGLVNEAIGSGMPLVFVPSLGHDQGHPAFGRTVRMLREAGVAVLLPDHDTTDGDRPEFPWRLGLAALPEPSPRASAGPRDGEPGPEHTTSAGEAETPPTT
jgi:hypothetical protein